MYFVDSHIHLIDSYYNKYINLIVDSIYKTKIQIFSMSVDLESSIKNIHTKNLYFKKSDLMKIFVGIHPEYAHIADISIFSDFLLSNSNIIDGIGEIGLDPTYTLYDPSNTSDVQIQLFTSMLDLAEKLGKPISIHSRRSLTKILEILSSYRIDNIVFHWYDGSKKLLKQINDNGYFVSFGPYLLYSSDKQILLIETNPNFLLFETDGPIKYKKCFDNVLTTPVLIPTLVNFASIIKRIDFNEFAEIICKNSKKFISYF